MTSVSTMTASPQWNGVDIKHMRQYKACVRLEYETVVRDSDIVKEKRDKTGTPTHERMTHRTWHALERPFVNFDLPATDGGQKFVVAALEKLDKAMLDDIDKRRASRRVQDVTDNIQEEEGTWNDLR